MSELVLTIPEVRAHLRGVTLPLRNLHLRALVCRALKQETPSAEPHELWA